MIRNDSPRMLAGAKAILRVDDKPTEVVLPEIAPARDRPRPAHGPVSRVGAARPLAPAPRRRAAGRQPALGGRAGQGLALIRLVDGEPSSEPFGSEVDYLAAPLSIGIGAAEAWRVEVVLEQDFLSPRLEPPDVLVLANVAAPTPEQAERLGQLVSDGHGPHDLHRRRSSTSASTTTCSSGRTTGSALPAEEPGRREHPRACSSSRCVPRRSRSCWS